MNYAKFDHTDEFVWFIKTNNPEDLSVEELRLTPKYISDDDVYMKFYL